MDFRLVAVLVLCGISRVNAQPPAALEGHVDAVASADYSPDGKLIVSGSFDRTIKIWNAATGEHLRTVIGHSGQVLTVAIAPSGRQFASGSRDRSVKLWDLYIPTPLQQLTGHTDAVNAVLVQAEPAWSATAGSDKLVKLWGADGTPLRDLPGHQAAVLRLAANSDGTQLASGDANGVVRLWNPADGASLAVLGADTSPIIGLGFHPTTATLLTAAENGSVKLWALPVLPSRKLIGHTQSVTAVALSVDAKLIVTGGADASVRVFNGEDGALLRSLKDQPGPVTAIDMNDASGFVASCSSDGVIKLWNVADGVDRLTLRGHVGQVHDIHINAKGDMLVSAGEDGSIRLWRIPVAPTPLVGNTMPVLAVAVSRDGKLVATGSTDKSIKLFNAVDATVVRTLSGSTAAVRSVVFRGDNSQLASADDAGDIRLWDPAKDGPQGLFSGHVGPATSLVYLPDGKTLISSGDDGTLRWWTLPPPPTKPLAAAAVAVNRVVKSTAGNEIIVGSADGVIRLFTVANAALARPLVGHVGPVSALATGGAIVASGDVNGDIRLWTLSTAVALPTIAAHGGPILALAVNTQGTQLASAGEDGTVRIWKLPVPAKPLAGAALPVTVTSFSHDGGLVASSGLIGGKTTIIIRDAASGAVKSTISGLEAAVTSLSFSGDKTKLISGSADKIARVWNIAAAQGVELAQFTMDVSVTAVAISADGQQAYGGAATGVLKQWKVADGQEVRAFTGHTAAIASLQIHGATLVSGSADTTVRQWNLANGAAIRSLAHGAAVTHVAISLNGAIIASAGADKLVKLWNAADGAALPVLSGHTDVVRQVAISADGSRIVSASADGLRMWDPTGKLLERFPLGDGGLRGAAFDAKGLLLAMDKDHVLHVATPSLARLLRGHEGPVNAVAFAPAGTTLVSAGADKTVRLWSVADGKAMATFTGATGAIVDVAISTDGKLLAAAGADNMARIWPVPTQATAQPVAPQIQLAHPTSVNSVAFSPDNLRLAAGLSLPANTPAATAIDLTTVTVWDLASGRPLQRLTGHAADVVAVEFLADGTTVVSGSVDKTTLLRPLSATRLVVGDMGKLIDVSLSTDGTQLATAGEDKKIKVWNTKDGSMMFEVDMAAATPTTVAIRGDKLQLTAAGSDNKLYLWPLTAQGAGAVVNVELPSTVVDLCYSVDGEKLAIACTDKQLRVFDSADAILLEMNASAETLTSVAFTPDGLALAAGAGNAGIFQPLSLVRHLLGHEGAVTTAVFIPDGTAVISGGADKTLRFWTLADGRQARTFTGAVDAITDAAVSADGATLVASSSDKFTRTWNLTTTTPTVAPALNIPHASVVHAVSISANGGRVSTAAEDGVVRVWDVASGRELQRFSQHEGGVLSVALAADGKKLVSGGADKTAQVASIAAEKLFVAGETKLGDAVFLSDGSAVATSGSDKQVKIWDADGKPIRQLSGAAVELARLAIRGDGMQIAAADSEGRLFLWSATDGKLQQTIETGAVINDLCYSSDHQRIAAAGADNHLRVFRTDDGQPLQDQVAAAPLLAVRFSGSGSELLTGSADKSASVWAYASPTPVADLAGHTGPVLNLAYSGDGKLLASTSSDGTIRTWNLETNQAIRAIGGHVGSVYAVRFTSDSQQLVSCGADGTVRVWTTASGAAVRKMTIELMEGERVPALFDVAISPNGQLAAASGQDGVIRLWNFADGQPAKSIEAGPDPAYRIQFLPTNQLLATGHAGNLTIWNPANAAQVSAKKIPGVPYSAALSPVAKLAAIPCADGKTYFVTLP
jgi:WD40 repeat protein